MQFTTVLALLTALATSAHAAIPPSYQVEDFQDPFSAETFIGTFDTFVDPGCSVGGRGITVDSVKKAGLLPSNVISVKAYIQDQKCSCKTISRFLNDKSWC